MALCKLVTLEMVPAVIDQVLKALSHELVAVRKKAVMVLHRLHQINPELIQYHHAACRQSLFDKDPSVMVSSSVYTYIEVQLRLLNSCSVHFLALSHCVPNTQYIRHHHFVFCIVSYAKTGKNFGTWCQALFPSYARLWTTVCLGKEADVMAICTQISVFFIANLLLCTLSLF